MYALRNTLLCGALCWCPATAAISAAPRVADTPPPAVKARELAALPGGHWLALDKRALRLYNAAGDARAELAVRGAFLDSRPTGQGARAVVFDADEQRPLLLDIDPAAGDITVVAALPAPTFALEALCLYRDTQRLDHLFLVGKDGQAEQWLLSGPEPRLLRRLAVPPQTERCRTDDARGLLLLDEKDVGTWAYAADGEGVPRRALVVRKKALRGALPRPVKPALPIVIPRAQTEPVARRGDAADDPAIWIHPRDQTQSLVLATNKKQGLLSYDLHGRQRQLLEAGRLNNVDVRQGVRLGGNTFDLAVATQRDENALAIFEIDANGHVRDAGRIATEMDAIYGTCLYRPRGGGLEVFVNNKDGRFAHYRIDHENGVFVGTLLRRFAVASQPEGCVTDDGNGRLFVGEEKRGIWVMAAAASAANRPRLILPVGPRLAADVEGLALYHGARARYLVASSQGDSSYVVLDADPPFAYRGAFRIGIAAEAGIDGVSDTDGLEATALDLGDAYGQGMLVVQDGYKRLPDAAQNFKYVAWDDIARALGLE